MQWWVWVIIWVGLVLALIGMLVFFGFRLFRKAMTALSELTKLGEQVATITENVEQLTVQPSQNAILVGYPKIVRQREAHVERKALRKELRREKALERGKLLIRTDYRQRTWPHAR